MLTTREQIAYLLPNGSRCDGSLSQLPVWPPDLFAVTASLVDISGGYRILVNTSPELKYNITNNRTLKSAVRLGRLIRENSDLSELSKTSRDLLLRHWNRLIKPDQTVFIDEAKVIKDQKAWIWSALFLMVVSDEACENIGFHSYSTHPSWISHVWAALGNSDMHHAFQESLKDSDWYSLYAAYCVIEGLDWAFAAYSATIAVSADRVCVLPKSIVTTVGCTIRSLSKHLSLHPGSNQVQSIWHDYLPIAHKQYSDLTALNVLVIPFPFTVPSTAFTTGREANFSTFTVNQPWLNEFDTTGLAKDLIDNAIKEGRRPDIVLFPELSVDKSTYEKLHGMIQLYAKERPIILIAGVSKKSSSGNHINDAVITYAFIGEDDSKATQKIEGFTFSQSKHHRWNIGLSQVKDYGLDNVFDPSSSDSQTWWESTEIRPRKVNYSIFRKNACFATLICEDLARQDPCKPSIQAVGPNLVFSLLMDSPQLKSRWPGRYTIGLTDDPSSSVLTVTSLGMVKRSNYQYNGTRQTIALWGQPGHTREIDLPQGHHAIILTLVEDSKKSMRTSKRTLDNRETLSPAWDLVSVTPLKHRPSSQTNKKTVVEPSKPRMRKGKWKHARML